MNLLDKIESLLYGNKQTEYFNVYMACISHTGKVRTQNEDNVSFAGKYFPLEHQSMEEVKSCKISSGDKPAVAIFDGMGGESAGELASYTAAKKFTEYPAAEHWDSNVILKRVLEINDAVCKARKENRFSRIGSTMTMLAFDGKKLWAGNLGDSPAYRFRDGRLTSISHAHTNAKLLAEQGITDKKPGLTQFLGIDAEEFTVEPFVAECDVKKGDIYLISSDGLTDMVSEEKIIQILSERENELEKKVQKLLNEALDNGGRDNITIVLCKIM